MQAQLFLSVHIPAHGNYFHIYIRYKYTVLISDLPDCSVGRSRSPKYLEIIGRIDAKEGTFANGV